VLAGLAEKPVGHTWPVRPQVFTTGDQSMLQHSMGLHVAPLHGGAFSFGCVPLGQREAEHLALAGGAGGALQHSWREQAEPEQTTAAGFLGRKVPAGHVKPTQVGAASQQDLGVQVLAWGQVMLAALSLSLDLAPHCEKPAQVGFGLQQSICAQEEPRHVMPEAFGLRWLPTGQANELQLGRVTRASAV
jgi:hypothetical protein